MSKAIKTSLSLVLATLLVLSVFAITPIISINSSAEEVLYKEVLANDAYVTSANPEASYQNVGGTKYITTHGSTITADATCQFKLPEVASGTYKLYIRARGYNNRTTMNVLYGSTEIGVFNAYSSGTTYSQKYLVGDITVAQTEDVVLDLSVNTLKSGGYYIYSLQLFTFDSVEATTTVTTAAPTEAPTTTVAPSTTAATIIPLSASDVPVSTNWESGEYSYLNGKKSNNASRIRLNALVTVDPTLEYTFTTGCADANVKFLVRQYRTDGSFLFNSGDVSDGSIFKPRDNAGYISISMRDTSGAALTVDMIGVSINPVVIGAVPTTAAPTTTVAPTTTTVPIIPLSISDVSDAAKWESGEYHSNGGAKTDNENRIRLNALVTVDPALEYTFTTGCADANVNFLVRQYTTEGVFITSTGTVSNGGVVRPRDTAGYFSISMYNTGSTPLTYDMIGDTINPIVVSAVPTTTVTTTAAPVEKGELNLDLNNSGVEISADGSNVTGSETKTIENGTPVTLTAKPSGNEFLFWTEDGKVRAEGLTYSFTMNGARNVKAVFAPGVNEGTIVIYRNVESDTQQILGHETYLTAAEISTHLVTDTVAYCYGKTFTGWSKTVTEIQSSISNKDSIVYVDAVFADAAKTYTVMVNGGSITEGAKDSYNTDDIITVVATDTENFKCWTDTDGAIVSTNATFAYKVGNRDVVFTAQSTSPSAAQINLSVDDDAETGRLKIYNSYYLPEGMTVVDVGLIYTKTAAATLTLEDVNGTTIKATHLGATGKQIMQIFNTISNTAPVTLCGYIVYTDSEGATHTLYSTVYTK